MTVTSWRRVLYHSCLFVTMQPYSSDIWTCGLETWLGRAGVISAKSLNGTPLAVIMKMPTLEQNVILESRLQNPNVLRLS